MIIIQLLCCVLGGGFRDSLADMAEELCPSSADDPMPLDYFVRTPNQVRNSLITEPFNSQVFETVQSRYDTSLFCLKVQDSSSVNRDTYIPSPSCKEFAKLEWLGMIMGACLRSGREHLVSPSLID